MTFNIDMDEGEDKKEFTFEKCPKKIRIVKEEKQKESCYIATAVYGNYNAQEVLVLREFRDNFLHKYFFGRIFIKLYYFISPILVSKFGNNKKILAHTKKFLDKLVHICKKHNNRG